MAAAVPEDTEELEEAVATLNVQPKHTQPKKKVAKGGKSQGKLCHSHQKYGDQTWKCADPHTCTWSGYKEGQRLQQQPPPRALTAVFSTWRMWPAPGGTWWTLAAPSASYPTSFQLSPQGHT